MIDTLNPDLSIAHQCRLLNISRSSFYYKPVKIKAEDLELMRKIDELYLQHPCWGSRSMRNHLHRLGWKTNRKRIQRLMRLMGIEAIYPKPRTSRPHPEHQIYPYLLRNLSVERPNQVWAADITYIPMSRGFMYLVVVMDWYSRKVLSWRISNSLDAGFCVEALHEALMHYGAPEIFNTDQGAQFTSEVFIKKLKENGTQISMDGRGRVQDNIFIERLWWSLKYQYLYLRCFDTGAELRNGLKDWFTFYNRQRCHQGLGGLTPDEVYYSLKSPCFRAA